jgi:hypothetical protein
MPASLVHSVIAAALENPELLARWRREPDLLHGYGVDAAELDLDALWKFAGLTAKVRHNGLRAELPLTFRLLNVAGLEIEVFAAYASRSASVGYANTLQGRAQNLLTFLEDWLDFGRREHVLLWDVIRYELALARLSGAVSVPALPGVAAAGLHSPLAKSVPCVCGEIIMHEMRSDPRMVGVVLQGKSPRLDEVSLGTFYFCYWRRGAAAEIHIIELDELGFYLLSLVDGNRSAADLSRMIGGGNKPARALLEALRELAAVGLLSFDMTREQCK